MNKKTPPANAMASVFAAPEPTPSALENFALEPSPAPAKRKKSQTDNRVATIFRLDMRNHNILKVYCAKNNVPLNTFLDEAVRFYAAHKKISLKD